jgi:hypothetical protein
MREHAMTTAAGRLTWDRVGIAASGLCLIHCVGTPLMAMLVSVAGASFWGGPWVHRLMVLVVVPVAALALVRGYRRHARAGVLLLGGLGAAAIAAAGLAPEGVLGAHGDPLVTSAGSLCVIAAHWWNLRELACRQHGGDVAVQAPRRPV